MPMPLPNRRQALQKQSQLKKDTGWNGQNPIPISETIQALPLHSNVTEIEPADIVSRVRSIPVYTDKDIEALLRGVKERNEGDVIKGNITLRTSNTGGIMQADDLVAISGKLFPHIAWGYMSSGHYALEKFTTIGPGDPKSTSTNSQC